MLYCCTFAKYKEYFSCSLGYLRGTPASVRETAAGLFDHQSAVLSRKIRASRVFGSPFGRGSRQERVGSGKAVHHIVGQYGMIWVYMGVRGFAMCSTTKLILVQKSCVHFDWIPTPEGCPSEFDAAGIHSTSLSYLRACPISVSVSVIGGLVSKTTRLGPVGYHMRWRAFEVAKGVKESRV